MRNDYSAMVLFSIGSNGLRCSVQACMLFPLLKRNVNQGYA